MSMDQLEATEADALNEIDLDHMVSEVKQQTYNQERLKFNFQIVLKELRQQRGTIQGLKYLEQENRNLKQTVSDGNQALKRLIESVKAQAEFLKTQTDQIMADQIEQKEKQEDSDRRINQQQLQLQTQIEKQRSNERVHDTLNQEISHLGLSQNELKFSLEKTQDQFNILSSKTDSNSQEISSLKNLSNELRNDLNEVKNQQQNFQQSMKSLEKRVTLVEENHGKLGEKIEGSNRRIEGHSAQIKEIYELIKKSNQEIKSLEKQIQEKEKKISSLDTAFTLKSTENDKEFSQINSEIDKLKNQLKQVLQAMRDAKPAPQKLYDDDLESLKKLIDSLKGQLNNFKGQFDGLQKQVDSLTGLIGGIKGDTDNHAEQLQQLQNQLAKLGNFITRDQLEKGIKEMKDFQVQWNKKIELFVNKEIDELKRLLSKIPKSEGVTEEQVQIYILEVLQKAADKQQTKKALLYLENLIQGLHKQDEERPQGPLPPFTCQSLMWSAPRCAACLNSGEPGKCPTGCSHGFEKNNTKMNKMICCQQSLKVQCEKNLPQLFSTPKFVIRPMTAKNNVYMPKSQNQISSLENINSNGKNLSMILNVDLDILPKNSQNSQGDNKKILKYQDKKLVQAYDEIAKMESDKSLKNHRFRTITNNES